MSLLRVDIEERVAVVTLDDPDRRNVLSLDLVGRLIRAYPETVVFNGALWAQSDATYTSLLLLCVFAVMQRHGLTEDEAFKRLRRTAMDTRRPMVEIARAVLVSESLAPELPAK